MKSCPWRLAALVIVGLLIEAIPASAQVALTLPATGTSSRGIQFTGTLSINRFEPRGDDIVAVGFVSGVLSRWGHRSPTVVAGEVAWPVIVRLGGQQGVSGPTLDIARPSQIAWSPGASSAFRLLPVQAPSCPVLDLTLASVNVDLLGVRVALSAVSLNLAGASDQPLGALVCAVSGVLDNVADLVNLLNRILALLTGLLGGLTGGLGGAVAVP